MRRLLLLRHAQAGFQDGVSDFNRKIDEGLHDIPFILRKYEPFLAQVDFVICSSAVRAVQTYQKITAFLGKDFPTLYSKDLYNARSNYRNLIWQLVNDIKAKHQTILVIAHNPGLTDFYNHLTCLQCEHIHFPILGMAQIDFYEGATDNVYAKALIG